MVELHPRSTEPFLYLKALLLLWLSGNKGLQGFMMMVVIRIVADVTVSLSAFAEIYIASPAEEKTLIRSNVK